ncbi:prepilin-type cleavage/methylation domain-containing protein [Gallibacterium melopsittaci]|uniref:Prepilin-type cleavage/methylation domain-containing protein n=1 Tax=Gallibacterium melopsittaci TaxID=516063 RepID=A0ABV6HVK6_9PAST
MQKYYAGITLIEVLTVLLIMTLVMFGMMPTWQQFNTQIRLYIEQWRLQQYLLQVQQRANHTMTNWKLRASISADRQRWCLIAQEGESLCDCLSLANCSETAKLVYYPYTKNINFITKEYYPQLITSFDNTRHTMRNACFLLQSGSQRVLFKYSGVGGVKITNNDSTSACLNYAL